MIYIQKKLSGQCAHRVTVTGVHINASMGYGSTVAMGACGPRVFTGRSGGETTAASHSEDSLD